jgi:hypothetical protein
VLIMVPRALSAWLRPRRYRLRDGVVLNPQLSECFLETLTATGIVALLLAYAAAAYPPAIFKAAMTEAANLSAAYKTEILTDLAVHGRLPDTLAPLDGNPGAGRYFSGFEWRDDELVASLQPGIARRIAAAATEPVGDEPLTISFRIARTAALNRTILVCGRASPPSGFEAEPVRHTTVPESYLPFFCRI